MMPISSLRDLTDQPACAEMRSEGSTKSRLNNGEEARLHGVEERVSRDHQSAPSASVEAIVEKRGVSIAVVTIPSAA